MAYKFGKRAVSATALALCTALISFSQTTPPPPPPPAPPAPPAVAPPLKKPAKIENFEDAQKELQKAQEELERTMKDFKMPPPPPPVDMAEIQKNVQQVDLPKIRQDVMKQLDEQVNAQALTAEKRAEIQKQVEVSLKKAEAEMKNLKMPEMAKVEANMKEAQQQMQEQQVKMKDQLKKAQEQLDKAREELKEYETFVNSLEKDGLINKDAYTIEEKDGTLYINGKAQPASVYEKYRSFLELHKGAKISKSEKGLQVGTQQ